MILRTQNKKYVFKVLNKEHKNYVKGQIYTFECRCVKGEA